MSELRWIRVTTRDSIPPREGRVIKLADGEIALFNLGERFLAVENRCPHKGGPLADGIVTACAVVCPLHAWRIDLDTGAVERPAGAAGCVRTYATRMEEDIVFVELPASALARAGEERAA